MASGLINICLMPVPVMLRRSKTWQAFWREVSAAFALHVCHQSRYQGVHA